MTSLASTGPQRIGSISKMRLAFAIIFRPGKIIFLEANPSQKLWLWFVYKKFKNQLSWPRGDSKDPFSPRASPTSKHHEKVENCKQQTTRKTSQGS
jgi:hypothetical protein